MGYDRPPTFIPFSSFTVSYWLKSYSVSWKVAHIITVFMFYQKRHKNQIFLVQDPPKRRLSIVLQVGLFTRGKSRGNKLPCLHKVIAS